MKEKQRELVWVLYYDTVEIRLLTTMFLSRELHAF